MELVRYYAKTDAGPYLNVNEDSCLCDLENNIFFILDGFGGSGIGDEGVKYIQKQLMLFYKKSSADLDATMPYFFNSHYSLELNALMNSLFYAHRLMLKKNQELPYNRRAGSSGIFLNKSGENFNAVLVGLASLFLIRDHQIIKIFQDDQRLAKGIPYNGIGMYEHLDYVVKEFRVRSGDRLVMMSDGVCSVENVEEIQTNLLDFVEDTPKVLCEGLMDLAEEFGMHDNQTIIILDY